MPDLTRATIPGPVPLAYLDSGGGFPLVFLHGAMGRGACWQKVMRALVPRYRCLALDQRGHGRSGKPRGGYQREDSVQDLERVVDALGLERFALIGHSTGALNTWVYAARHPERVAAVVIEDMHATGRGAVEVEAWRTWLASWPLPFATHGDVRAHFAAMRPALGDYFAELFEECLDGWRPLFATATILETIGANEARDWWDELAAVACPALVVKGGDSDYLTLPEAERMASTLPQGRLAVIPDANHTVHVDQPDAYLELVETFLAEAVEGLSSRSPRPSRDRSPRSVEAHAAAPGPA